MGQPHAQGMTKKGAIRSEAQVIIVGVRIWRRFGLLAR